VPSTLRAGSAKEHHGGQRRRGRAGSPEDADRVGGEGELTGTAGERRRRSGGGAAGVGGGGEQGRESEEAAAGRRRYYATRR
jgi:hypothetical protein